MTISVKSDIAKAARFNSAFAKIGLAMNLGESEVAERITNNIAPRRYNFPARFSNAAKRSTAIFPPQPVAFVKRVPRMRKIVSFPTPDCRGP